MINIQSALSFLNRLWSDERGAFREAISLDNYWQLDNYVAWIVMRRYNPRRANLMRSGFIKDYTSTRWCILVNNTKDFIPSPQYLPDYMRYADLVALQFFYLQQTGRAGKNLHFGILNKMYGLKHPGFLYEKATPTEAYTMYKLCLFSLCATEQNWMDLSKQLLKTVSEFQVRDGDEAGGIKTEYVPPEWESNYPQLLRLANCETTCLAIMAQNCYDSRKRAELLQVGTGVGMGMVGVWRAMK